MNFLYPEKSRKQLELDYHSVIAALHLSARELLQVGGHAASTDMIEYKVGDLLNRSRDVAEKSASVRFHRNHTRIAHLLIATLLLAGAACGQARPGKVELALDAADVTIRALDLTSTHTLLNSPCKCFHEDDPLSPGGKALGPLLLFQASMSASTIAGGHRLMTHGHRRLGMLTLAADIAMESWAVQHNLRQHGPMTPSAPAPNTTGRLLAAGGR